MKFKKEIYGDPIINVIVAQAEGQKTHSRPYAFVSKEDKFSHITGGIVLPTFDMPGYLLTVGVRFDDQIIDCIDEYETADTYRLIARAQKIQTEYGVGVVQNWWGDPEDLMSLVNEKNIKGNAVYISAPIDNDRPDQFQIYLARLRVGLSETYQTFFIRGCEILRNYIDAFVQTGSEKAVNNPAMYTAGALLHTLLMMRPWEQAVETVDLIPTTSDERRLYGEVEKKKTMYRKLYGMVA